MSESTDRAVTVEIVGSGVVSTSLPEFATTLSPSGDTIWFNRTPADRSRLELFQAIRVGETWTNPVRFPPTEGQVAIDPFMTTDGRRLYFSSNRPRAGGSTSFNIWYLERTPTGWSEPFDVGNPVNSDSSDVFNSLSADGTLVFSSTRDGARRIYLTTPVGNRWSEPVPVRFGDQVAGSNPMLSPDGRFMVYSTRGNAELPDLYVSCREDAVWTQPQRLPDPINSRYREFAPGIANGYLYFTSERPGIAGAVPDSVRPPGDIYRTPLDVVAVYCRIPSG